MDGGFALRDRVAPMAERTDQGSAPRAFESFFRAHHDFVWRNLRRLGVASAVVDDALQDVFVTAHRRRAQLRADASERAWLYTILRRVAFRYRRGEQRRRRKLDALAAVAPTHSRDRAADGIDARCFLGRFLAELGDKRGPVFVMMELEGLSGPEVAQALGLGLNTVYSRLRLGRLAFGRELGRMRALERDELLGRARRADDPPVGAAAATWMLLGPRTLELSGPPSSATGWSAGAQVMAFAATVAAGTMLVLGVRAALPVSDRVFAGEIREPAVTAVVLDGRERPELPAIAAVPSPPRPVVRALPIAPTMPPVVRRRPAPPEIAQHGSSIDDEARLLKAARTALTRGEASLALSRLDAHARRFPRSMLSDLRDAMRVSALCSAGEPARARREAARFEQLHPQSRFVERVRATCRGDGS